LGRSGSCVLVIRAKLDGLVAAKEPVACLALRAEQNSKGHCGYPLYGLNGHTTAVV
jgi:hypothetical protein